MIRGSAGVCSGGAPIRSQLRHLIAWRLRWLLIHTLRSLNQCPNVVDFCHYGIFKVRKMLNIWLLSYMWHAFFGRQHNSRFNEGLLTLKSFMNVFVGFQKFVRELLVCYVLMTDLLHASSYCHSKYFFLLIYQRTDLWPVTTSTNRLKFRSC